MKKKTVWIFLSIFLALSLITVLFPDLFLNRASSYMIDFDPLRPREAIVILAGSSTGARVKEGARLFREGYGKKLVFSGNEVYPETFMNDLMKTYALSLGVPGKKILSVRMGPEVEVSTWGEATVNLDVLKKNRIRSFILVTSDFHTHRAKLVYLKQIEQSGLPIDFIVHPVADPVYPMFRWWTNRGSSKQLFLEYLRLLYFYLEH